MWGRSGYESGRLGGESRGKEEKPLLLHLDCGRGDRRTQSEANSSWSERNPLKQEQLYMTSGCSHTAIYEWHQAVHILQAMNDIKLLTYCKL